MKIYFGNIMNAKKNMSGRPLRRRFYDLEVDARELEDPCHDPERPCGDA